ncbi:aminotransferase class III-fold pyridoxal phosphate-dependent enzyme, partial [Staphylococcus aureus]|uniref:aminotransferase class III-fold pyridoxal phosphate-dependent enzyme n=1 Tax=Staphylococcus aureus TaxID=1280 RepID=UPI001023B82D
WSLVSHFYFTHDLITFGKSLAGGLPLSAIVGRQEIMNCLEAPAHLFTTGANPVSCEAALATLQMIDDQSPFQASEEQVEYVRTRM